MRQKPPNDLADVGRKEDGKMPTCETDALHSNSGHRVIEVKLIEVSRLSAVVAIATMLACISTGWILPITERR